MVWDICNVSQCMLQSEHAKWTSQNTPFSEISIETIMSHFQYKTTHHVLIYCPTDSVNKN